MDCPKRMCDTEAAVGLPDDPLVDILSRVPVKSVCRFKCVSKGWRDLIADPFHRKKLPQTLEGFFFTGVEPRESDAGGDDCGSDYGDDGEQGGSGGSDDDYGDGELGGTGDSDDDYGDGEQGGRDDSVVYGDGEQGGRDDQEPPRLFYGFIDVLKRSVRTVDFSYLSELPGPGVLEETRLLHCCNGLLLFAAHYSGCDISEGYIVCNPATKQCVAVPSSRKWHQMISESTSLLFNPGARRHFHLVQVFAEGNKTSVHVYSSETQAWSPNKNEGGLNRIAPYSPGVYVNGMLHLLSNLRRDQITVLDVEGNIQRIIVHAPDQRGRKIVPLSGYIGQSQGCLYYICSEQEAICDDAPGQVWDRLLIWVLQDYDRQQWILKDSVNVSKMFGKRDCDVYYNVVGIHPDHSLVFLVQHWDQKLVSYNIDSKEVCDVCTLGHGLQHITPYVPYFSEFGA